MESTSILAPNTANSQWGDGVIRQLADYIAANTEDSRGYSDKNLWRMKQFYETYRGADEKLSSLMRQINWTNNLTIMSRCKIPEERDFYIRLTAEERLSTRELDKLISRGLFERTMIDTPNLSAVLREIAPSSERSFRDRYVMDFLGKKTYANEYSMKQAIIAKMKDFILEVGKDFIYMGQEYRLQVELRISELICCSFTESLDASSRLRSRWVDSIQQTWVNLNFILKLLIVMCGNRMKIQVLASYSVKTKTMKLLNMRCLALCHQPLLLSIN